MLSSLALTLGAWVDPPDLGTAEGEVSSAGADRYTAERGRGTLEPDTMAALCDGINPPRHAEKARPTTVDRSGTIVALATTISNRPPFGRVAQLSICDLDGTPRYTLAVRTPGRIDVGDLPPGLDVLVRPETPNTMVKLLTPEQIAGARAGEPPR